MKAKERIEIGGYVTFWYTDESAYVGVVLHVPPGPGEMWIIRDGEKVRYINPNARTLESVELHE